MGETACRRKAFLSVFICLHLWFQQLLLVSGLSGSKVGRRQRQRVPVEAQLAPGQRPAAGSIARGARQRPEPRLIRQFQRV